MKIASLNTKPPREKASKQETASAMPRASAVPRLLWVVCLVVLPSALQAATHVTGTYSLGANPAVMADINGTPEYGLVFLQRSKSVTYNNVEYGTQVAKGYLNVNGQLNDGAGNLWLDLIPSTAASPSDSYYVVTINIGGQVHAEIWVVPEVTSVDAQAVRQAQPPSAAATAFYQFLQQSGSDLPQRLKLNFTGTGVACADNAGQLSTDCTITAGTGGGGSAPIASATSSGTVKTDSTAADPVVYLKASSDTLFAGKANTSHTHVESDVTSLVTDLAGKVPTSRTVSTTAPLGGGGSLAGNLTLSLPAANGSQNGYLSSGDWTSFNGKESALTFSAPLSRSVNTISCPTCELTGNKNSAGGYAGLSASSKLNLAQGQEVWSVTDLSDYSSTSGSGATALKTTISAPSGGQCLTWDGSDWVNGSCSGGSSNHNLLSATHPDTAAASPVLGDVLYANSTPAWTRLAGNTTTTKKYLSQTGNGTLSAAPAWGQVAAADISGLAASATTDTTNASNISSGTLAAARMNPTVNAHTFLGNNTGASAAASFLQPACGDLSNAAASCSTDTTNATNIGSGTLGAARLPATAVQTSQSNTWTAGTQDMADAGETDVLKAGTSASAPATCTANKSLYIKTDASPAGQQVFLCNSTGNGWNLIGDGGGAGGGITTLNTLTASTQTFATGTAGSDFNISSSVSTHTFNLPDASATGRGLVTTSAQTFGGTKTFSQVNLGGSGDFTLTATGTNGSVVAIANGTGKVKVADASDNTKKLGFDVSGNATGITGTIATGFTTAKTWTIPDATDTAVGRATTDTLTNKTLDAEGTGNTLTVPVKTYIAFASCPDGSNASLAVDAAATETVACYGTNTKIGVWQAADADAVTFGLHLPSDFTGAIDASIMFNSPDTTGTVIFNIATACVSTTGASADNPAYNAASAFSTITLSTPANASWKSNATGITATGCAAGGWANFKVTRATDTGASRVNVKGVMLTMRRAM